MLDDSAGNMTANDCRQSSALSARPQCASNRALPDRGGNAEDDSSHMLMRFSGIAESMGNSGALGLTPA